MTTNNWQQEIAERVVLLSKKDQFYRTLRLVLALSAAALIYISWKNSLWWSGSGATMLAFAWVVYQHGKVGRQLRHAQAMNTLVEQENSYQQGQWPEQDGAQYLVEDHPYAIHLDVVGRYSLFHFLNRTLSPFGNKWLAARLLHLEGEKELRETQEAVKELAQQGGAAYRVLGHLQVHKNHLQDEAAMKQVLGSTPKLSKATRIAMWAMPVVFFAGVLGMAANLPEAGSVVTLTFLLQLGIFGLHLKQLKQATAWGERTAEGLQAYANAMREFAAFPWQSNRLKEIAQSIQNQPAALGQLKQIVQQLNSLNNAPAALVFNGSILFHLHQFRRLQRWINLHGSEILPALDLLGKVECLLSLAQFTRNNATYAWPELLNEHPLEAVEMGHPLIATKERVCNTVSFKDHHLLVLTGSNMAGKSTFLRTVGINYILARAGAPVCAASFTAPYLDLWASMRNQDQLASRESYFYAEVKRLGKVVEAATKGPILILLDEVLRGTNSHDKRRGTLALVKKLHQLKAQGILATHDLEVGVLEEQLHGVANYCFEIEELEGKLNISYRLLRGISTTTTATYLMRSMGIVD